MQQNVVYAAVKLSLLSGDGHKCRALVLATGATRAPHRSNPCLQA